MKDNIFEAISFTDTAPVLEPTCAGAVVNWRSYREILMIKYNEFPIPLLIILIGFCMIVVFGILNVRRIKSALKIWEHKEKVRILDCRRVYISHPFTRFTTSSVQHIYRAHINEQSGKDKIAWIRIGSFLFGAFSDKVECIWGEPSNTDKK